MTPRLWLLLAATALAAPATTYAQAAHPPAEAVAGNPARWSQTQAASWYAKQPWLTGANYINAGSITYWGRFVARRRR